MSINNHDKLKKIALFKDNPDLAIFDQLSSLNDKIDELYQCVEKSNTLLQTLIDKEQPEFPTIPESKETDLTEVTNLLKEIRDQENKCEIKLQLD